MTTPFYSIIVPSYNREDEIRELLHSVDSMQFPRERFELIIADDGSTDGTADLVSNFKSESGIDLVLLQQDNKGPGAARNMGMENARGDVFIFVDSDCTVDKNWLRAIDDAFAEGDVDAFGGPDSYLDSFPPLLKAINYSMTSFITTGGIRGHKKKKLGKYYPRSFNMGLTREVYDRVGGFGGLRHGQDIEYSHRILESGARVILVPDAIVFHKRRTSLKKFYRQVFNWGVARINLYTLDKKMLEIVHALPAFATLGLFALLFLSFYSIVGSMLLSIATTIAGIAITLSALHAAYQYRHPAMLILVPIVMVIQILGYGLGFISAFIWRILLGRGEFTGFHRKYY